MKNWKTTTTAILSLVALIVSVATDLINNIPINWGIIIPAFIAAIGLIFAKDGDVTGGSRAQ
jgi:hypothetical protein